MKTSNPLPPTAQDFLKLISVNFRPKTVESYLTSLRRFHRFLALHSIPVEKVNRRHIEKWMKSFQDDPLGPVARTIYLLWIRAYLRWLSEHDLIDQDPETLIHPTDFPKIPQRLPRPLPPPLDKEIQCCFQLCPNKFAKAFLVMRHTGIRIGELIALERGCVKNDSLGNHFLKVPLGKLHNERLVPIDNNVLGLLEALGKEKNTTSSFLLDSKKTKHITRQSLQEVFRKLIRGLESWDTKPVTTHRLRHTYATELLNAGMSLGSVMHLLGHHHIASTLRYAAVTQKTILNEYRAAKIAMETNLSPPQLPGLSEPALPTQSCDPHLLDTLQLMRKEILQLPLGAERQRKLKRLSRIEHELRLLSNAAI